MKKLMMLAATMTIVGGAYSQDFYDYKASVKHPDLKTVSARVGGLTVQIPTKTIKTTSLYGYVVVECANCTEQGDQQAGWGWGYLVVANSKDKVPKILPVDLLAKAWDPKGTGLSTTWDAEGYLFAGDGKKQVPWVDDYNTDDTDDPAEYHFSGMRFGSTIQLFGIWNRADTEGNFRDAWLEAAGFGKAVASTWGDWCSEDGACMALDSLAGSVIGGMFLCLDPGEYICSPWTHTTDVVSGTWSIKHTTKVGPVALDIFEVPLMQDPADILTANWVMSEAVNGAIKKFGGYSFNTVVTGGIRSHYATGYLSTVYNVCGDSYQDLYNDR